jgi:hypothetical protein
LFLEVQANDMSLYRDKKNWYMRFRDKWGEEFSKRRVMEDLSFVPHEKESHLEGLSIFQS